MAEDSRIVILYRIAEKQNKNPKNKPDWIGNQTCLSNIQRAKVKGRLIVFGDNLDESKLMAEALSDEFIETKMHGNSETFLEVLDYALELDPGTIVYFAEDDYIHLRGFERIIVEGLERADYVSMYDHPDKYNGRDTKLFHTKSTHWQFTGSTTMTFATRVKTLAFDHKIFRELITTGTPPDHHIFTALTGRMGRRLATPIPGYATHGEVEYLAPIVNWEKYV